MRALFRRIDADLAAVGPRSAADRGEPMVSLVEFYEADGVETGLWECSPGGWHITDRPDTEIVHILSGAVDMTDDTDGSVRRVGPGDVMVLPKGWSGRWDILETTRKLYVVVA